LDKRFPKGKTRFRGHAMVLLVLAREEGRKEIEGKIKKIKLEERKKRLQLTEDLTHGKCICTNEWLESNNEEVRKQQKAKVLEVINDFKEEMRAYFSMCENAEAWEQFQEGLNKLIKEVKEE